MTQILVKKDKGAEVTCKGKFSSATFINEKLSVPGYPKDVAVK
jgi:hypothetical protein